MTRTQDTNTTAATTATTTATTGKTASSPRVRVVRRRTARRELPELDLRTPSGRRTLPY